ncbi:MAG: 3-dehydroquinate synthase [Kiritimatiellae bacterium]|nr:3-dehydroquinate synthase [Kiritimatiellia bacterium]
MKTIRVESGMPYDVLVARGLLDRAGEFASAVFPRGATAAVVTDGTVESLYAARVRASLEAAGFRTVGTAFPSGERSKTLATYGEVLSFLAASHVTRHDFVVALGGGVPGDLAGFAAATYLRGIPFLQIPTTLLAAVDSSVGGKTAVDLPEGKNLAGAFHQPRLVLCDPGTLATLPRETFADGVAEAVKYGVLQDRALFDQLAGGDFGKDLDTIIARCVAIKADFVSRDEFDRGARKFLNLGHTFGHAVEAASGFAVSHGQAVAIGMVAAARAAEKLGIAQEPLVEPIAAALEANGLPVRPPFAVGTLVEYALRDKKREGGKLAFVLPETIGRCRLHEVPVEEVPRVFETALDAGTQGC